MLRVSVHILVVLFFFICNCDAFAQCGISVNAGEDIYRCLPAAGPSQLMGEISGPYLNFNWSPTTGMSGSNTLSPTVTVNTTTNYVLTATAPDYGNNLISNGDFEGGNTSFTSDYTYSPGNLVPEGLYDVIDNPQVDHSGFAPCDDHTSGSGNMMVVNGAGIPNLNVWCQTVTVTPNTQYVLSAWVTSVVATSPARLQFNINGSPLGPIFNAPGSTCVWQNYFQIWNSAGNTTATICIVNQNTTLGGNDFALDDIVFAPVCAVTDTVTVHAVNLAAIASPPVVILPCEGSPITISGDGSSTGPNIQYEWTTSDGNIISGENTLMPLINQPGIYTLEVKYVVNGNVVCTKSTAVNVILTPNPMSAWITPPLPLGCGSPTTSLIGNSTQPAFSTYSWSTLNGNIVNGGDQKNCTVSQVGTYHLLVTNTMTGCTATAEVVVVATSDTPVANASSSGIITCANTSVPLTGSGSSSGPNISYAWSTPNGQITGPTDTLNTTAGAGGIYILSVANTSNNCVTRDTVTVPANVVPPSVQGTLPPQISCDPNQDTIQIFIFVGPPAFVLIHWTTQDGHIVSGQYTPAPQADQPGTYTVSVFDPANGCFNYDTSQVKANFTVPTADILPADTLTCQLQSIQLQGSGSSVGANFSIEWTASNGGNIVSGGNTLTPTVNVAGDYLLVLRDSVSLCTDSAWVSVAADTNIVVAIANAPDTLNCVANTVYLNADGSSSGVNFSYLWTTQDGNIVSGANTPTPVVNAAGIYQLLLTNTSNGCSATDLAIVSQDVVPPNIGVLPPDTLTCITTSLSLWAFNQSPGNLFSYAWSSSDGGNIVSGENTLTPVVNQPGLYTLVATNLTNGCVSTISANVSTETAAPIVAISAAAPLTCTSTVQILNSSGSSAGAEYDYQWSTPNGNIVAGANSPTPTVDSPGNYFLLITNTNNGCTASSSVSITQDTTPPGASILTAPEMLNCSTTQLELVGDGTGNAAWTTLDGHFVFTSGFTGQIDAPGIYVLTTTNPDNGCTSSASIQIEQNIEAPSLNIATPDMLTCTIGTLILQSSSNALNAVFSWQTLDGNFVTGQQSPTPTVDAPGVYTLTVTNIENGCTATDNTTVWQDIVPPLIQVSSSPNIDCNFPVQTIEAQNLSGNSNFVYQWTASNGGNLISGSNTLTPIVNAGGSYTLLTTNTENGCTASLSTEVQQDTAAPHVSAGPDNTLSCLTNSTVLNGQGSGGANLSYMWTASNGGNILSGGNSPNPTVNQAGTYTLLVQNTTNGCTATDTAEVFNDALAPTAMAGTADILTCSVLQTSLNATASTGTDFSYQWTAEAGGNILSGSNSLTPLVNAPGTYTLVVTNSTNGCTASSSVTVLQDIAPPTVSAGMPATLTCTTASVVLHGSSSGTSSFTWQTVGGNIVSGQNTSDAAVDQPGIYTLTATLYSNGCSALATTTVGIDTLPPAFQFNAPLLLTCSQTSTPLSANLLFPNINQVQVWWSTTEGNLVGPNNTLNTTVDQPGTYTFEALNTTNGCSSVQSLVVLQDVVPPTAAIAPSGPITCASPNIVLDASTSSSGPSFQTTWSASNGGSILNGSNTLSPTVGSTGDYTLLVTNQNNGCTATASVHVNQDTTPPVAFIAQPLTLTCEQTTAVLDGSSSSQGPQFSVSWATASGHIVSGQGTYTITVDQAGIYLLDIQNQQNGCTASVQMSVQQNTTAPGAQIAPPPFLHCNLPNISLEGSSPSVGNLSYTWSTSNGVILSGSMTPAPIVAAAGSYTLTVTNEANGCTSTAVQTVTAIPPPVLAFEIEQPDCFDPKGTIQIVVANGGAAPYQYSASNGQQWSNLPVFDEIVPGTYTLLVRDANGCTASAQATVNPPFLPDIELTEVLKISQGDSVLLTPLTNIPPAQVASWKWSPAEGLSCSDCWQPWAKPLRSQYYTVEVRDASGCKASGRILIQVSRLRNIYPPTAFSPDGDGQNDYFTLYAKGVKEIKRLSVFDRWGEELFTRRHIQPNDESLGWDGTFQGTAVMPAVFVWMAEIEFLDGEIEFILGDITLIR